MTSDLSRLLHCTRLLHNYSKVMHRRALWELFLQALQRHSSGIVLVCVRLCLCLCVRPTKGKKKKHRAYHHKNSFRPNVVIAGRKSLTSSARPLCCRLPKGYRHSRRRSLGHRSRCCRRCWHRWRRSWLRYRRRRRSPGIETCQYGVSFSWKIWAGRGVAHRVVFAATLSAVDALLGESVADALQGAALAELAGDEVVDAILGLVDGLDAGDFGLVEGVCR